MHNTGVIWPTAQQAHTSGSVDSGYTAITTKTIENKQSKQNKQKRLSHTILSYENLVFMAYESSQK